MPAAMNGVGVPAPKSSDTQSSPAFAMAELSRSRETVRVGNGCWSGLRLKGSLASGEAADRGEARHQPGANFYGFDPTGFDQASYLLSLTSPSSACVALIEINSGSCAKR